jgi:serine/threonine protein phosphatase 1
MMQTLIVGDIHGCYVELQALLDKAGLAESDSIIAAGDMVDRGPETPQVVNFFRSMSNARGVMGNHERKHVRFARHELRLANSQKISRQQLGDEYPAALAWMEGLPYFFEFPEALIIHGYLEPGVPLESQELSVLSGTMGGEKLLRERYDRPWYELYDDQKPVIVGHQNYTGTDQPFIFRDKVFGLDTDCVHGKSLTGLLLPSFRLISVPSRGNLWMHVRRTYVDSRSKLQRPKAVIAWSDEDNLALAQIIEKARQANADLLSKLRAEPGFSELNPRQQAKIYTQEAGPIPFATLMQLARLEKLDLDSARILLKNPETLHKIIDGGLPRATLLDPDKEK